MAQPIITDKIAGNNKSDYHLITTTHPYLIELGLGSFTIPSLSAWWNEKSHEGVYLHRKCINNQIPSTLGDPTNSIGDLLGISTDTEFFWNGWKPNKELENAGVYKKYDLSTYDGNTGSPSGSNPWTFSSAVGEVTIDNTLISTVGDPTKYIVGGTLDGSLNFKNNVYDYDATDGLENLSPIYDVVNLNRYMSAFSDFNPRSTWDKDEPNSNIAGQNTKQLFASHEFLTDIKTSKLGPYIEWSGEVTFYINEGHLCDQGITEWIPFKLHLFDSASSDVSANTVTLKSLKYVAPRRDVTGKLFGTKTDGGHTEYNPDDVASQGVGDIDLSMNPITKKWEGGSPTLFAKMVTKIGKPSVPTVEYLESSNTTDALDNDEYEGVKFIPTTGIAMPIRPQNGNPLQWQPNYLEPDDVRCSTGSVEKETLTVYNFSTQRQFSRDEEVMLTRIDGVWHVGALGVNLIEDEDVTSEVGKWGEFTYMMTNSRFFFKDKNRKDFTPREAELFFHKLYYEGDDINSNVDYGISGGWDKISTFNTNDIKEVYLDNGYAQTTSFDYLDQRLCGIRGKENHNGHKWDDKCAISTTSATINAAGHTIPGPESFGSRNAAHSAVFFGCVFPEGYVDTSPHLVKGRGYNISAESLGTPPGLDTNNYIDPQPGNNDVATLSATDGQKNRNNCRLPTRARFDEQLSDSNNHWERYSDEYSASLFYGHTVDKNQSCIQFPADVMTNASPSGANGSPLYPVHRFKNFHTPNGVIYNAKYQEVSKAFLQGIWLGKEAAGEDVVSKYDSAFDFTPKKRDTLMFRPLKMEGYIQFGDDPRSADESWVTDLSKTSAGNHRTGFSVEAHRTQKDNKRPCTAFFEDREKADGHADLWTTEYGLKWGGDIENKYNNDTTVQRSYNQYHDYLYWNKEYGPMKWTEGFRESGAGFWKNKGGNAYGVITTFNTVKANERIDFSTDNIYGMGAAGWGNIPFSISNGYQHQDKTWGVSQLRDSYRQENIPDLSVRIYQQHPRDQTLFDPRTFAVHHFNPDVRYANDLYMKDDGTTEAFYRTPQLSTEIDGVSDGQGIKYQYYYQDSFSVVDLRRMTRNKYQINPELGEGHANLGKYYPQNVQIDDHIFSDVVMNDTTPFGPVMAEKYWVIDSSRTGKLLPFKYRKQEVGISIPVGTKFVIDGTGSPNDPAQHLDTPNFDNMPASTILGKMCVKSKGTGYVAGDTVGLDDIVFKVETVEENSGDTQGAIKELKCISRGTGFSESQTAAHDDKFNSDTNGPITLGTLSTEAGEGFDAYFVSISVYYVDMIDPKPYLMKRDGEEIVRVASDVSQSTGPNTGHDAAAEAGAFVNETYGISYTLDPTLYSDNKEYDVFFHFHNDITMTWMASQEHFHGSSPTNYIGNNQTPAHEQHITVKINPR